MKTEEEKNIENKPLEDTDTVAWPPTPKKVLEYKDTVNDIDPTNIDVSGNGTASIDLESDYEIQLFKEKVDHFKKIGNNDFLGFTLVFGNTSSRAYEPAPGAQPTLTDKLDLSNLSPKIKLTLVDLCLPDCYRLIRNADMSIDPCDTTVNNSFIGGQTYELTLQKCNHCKCTDLCYIPFKCTKKECDGWTSVFPIPCQSICCISMLFRIDPADPCNCGPDCCLEEN